ncbi:putative lipoprotein [Myxococcus stipitatus DSM 14675]|uniref:Putative lipoprotein n=1 Tax=Myxococcus stipitatus (strain DSM 14675 / JCM 12634 / Mx s8) TaxID=1278073 RepID=L7UNR1_MYXSD|nr:lipoprotein [Myxococcus stipitatus]AGC48119.1 putative lipoprotein [Myxococcus stipitatus DSM 14675]
MTVSLRLLSPLLASLLALPLAGCDDDPAPPTPDAGSPDAGPYVWDGTYTELADPGDWIDPGAPYAPCSFDASSPDSGICEQVSRFDVSQCDRGALAALPQEGIYQAVVRNETRLTDGGVLVSLGGFGMRLLAENAGTSTMFDAPLLHRNTQGGDFSVTGQAARTGTMYTVVGCKTPAPGVITGCIATCRRGVFTRAGTFEAHRVAKGGEPESSGGLELLSEQRAASGHAVDVYVTKGHAYVVALAFQDKPGGLTVFDVSNPRAPLLKTSISLPNNANWNGVWAKGDALYVAGLGTGTHVFDISNPAAPSLVRIMPAGRSGMHTVLVDGNRLYGAGTGVGTHVYDITEPLNPVLRTVFTLPEDASLGDPHDSFAYEGRLYISNSSGGYTIVDPTDLDNVKVLGTYMRPDEGFAHHNAVGTFGGKTIAFEGGEFAGSHVRVLDVTNPARIVKIGEFRMRQTTSMHNLILRGNLLYVAWYQEGLRVLDVSNPTQPKQVAHYQTFREEDPDRGDSLFEGAFGIRVPGDGYVYVADSSRGLLIFKEL